MTRSQVAHGVTPHDKAWPGKGAHGATMPRDIRVTTCHKKRTSIDLLYYGFHNLGEIVTRVTKYSNRFKGVCTTLYQEDM